MRLFRFLAETVEANLYLLRDYSKLIGGSLGRLVLSLAYFTAVANTLSVADFGLFATASGTGVVLSRIAGLGFVSPLYRAATRKPQLVGVYTAGYLAALALSLPLVVLAAAGFYLGVFRGDLALLPFALIIVAEVLFWRSMEVVCIVNNGLGRFGRASLLVIGGTATKSIAALVFSFGVGASGGILAWSALYLGANAVAALAGIALIYPRQRLRLRPRLYLRRASDSAAVAGAEVLFYLQSEMDKILVLSIGGPQIAGVYAMLMRLIDLTALPIRSFNTMAVQKLMRAPEAFSSWRMRWGIEGGIALVSAAGMAGLGLVLLVAPTLLGRNVADAAPLVLVAIAVPAFRNLVEYESELLYARGLTGTRAGLLALLGLMKAGLLTMLLASAAKDGSTGWIAGLNGVFATLWLASAMTAYTAMDARPGALRLSWRRRKARRQPG